MVDLVDGFGLDLVCKWHSIKQKNDYDTNSSAMPWHLRQTQANPSGFLLLQGITRRLEIQSIRCCAPGTRIGEWQMS